MEAAEARAASHSSRKKSVKESLLSPIKITAAGAGAIEYVALPCIVVFAAPLLELLALLLKLGCAVAFVALDEFTSFDGGNNIAPVSSSSSCANHSTAIDTHALVPPTHPPPALLLPLALLLAESSCAT